MTKNRTTTIPSKTTSAKYENYTKNILQTNSNLATMEMSKSPAIESSDQTKAAKHEPLVYRVEEIAQLLAISPRDAPKVNIEKRTIWDEKTMLAALQTM